LSPGRHGRVAETVKRIECVSAILALTQFWCSSFIRRPSVLREADRFYRASETGGAIASSRPPRSIWSRRLDGGALVVDLADVSFQ
jgi:hypothetical protein